MMMKVEDKLQTCGSEEVSETNAILFSTAVSGLKVRAGEWGRMQTGYPMLQGIGEPTVSSNTPHIPKHCFVILSDPR